MGLVKYGGKPFPEAVEGAMPTTTADVSPAKTEETTSIKGNAEQLIKRIIKRGAKTEILFQQSATEMKPVKIQVGRSVIRYARNVWLPIEDKFLEALERTKYEKPLHSVDQQTGRPTIKMVPIHRYQYHTRTLQQIGL
jgi:hypothetical protein